MRALVRGLLVSQRIETTVAKAKETRRVAEKLITIAKKDDLHSRRMVFAFLRDEDLTNKLFKDISPLFKNRNGGYTRIILSRTRRGDCAPLAILELTEKKIVAPKVKHRKEKAPEAKAAEAPPKAAARETAPPVEKPKEVAPEKRVPHKKETKKGTEIHPTPKAQTGFVSTLRKFFKGRTK